MSKEDALRLRNGVDSLEVLDKRDCAEILRSCALAERGVPYAVLDPVMRGTQVILKPGATGFVPVEWITPPGVSVEN